MRKLGMDRLHDVEMMTLSEFHYKRYAQEYKEVDEEYRLHKLAYLTYMAGGTKNVGTEKKPKHEPLFKSFDEFFNYKKNIDMIEKGWQKEPSKPKAKKKEPSIAELAAKRNRGE